MKCIIGVEQEPRVQFTLTTGEDGPPMLIRLPDNSVIVKIGTYLSPGNRYCYRRANEPAVVPETVVVKPWEEYTGLEG